MLQVDEVLECLSCYLILFLQNLVRSDIKQVEFGQAVTQCKTRTPSFPCHWTVIWISFGTVSSFLETTHGLTSLA